MKVASVFEENLGRITVTANLLTGDESERKALADEMKFLLASGADKLLVELDVKNGTSHGIGALVSVGFVHLDKGIKVAYYSICEWARFIMSSVEYPARAVYDSETKARSYLFSERD